MHKSDFTNHLQYTDAGDCHHGGDVIRVRVKKTIFSTL